ncbi:MAG: N-6 DNA methylase [Aristaeellaceae bacterium]
MAERITIDELKSYLWQSAVLLRTHIDAGAYKQYIFPLMFFKRICDVYDEETAKAVEEYGEDMEFYPEEELHTFLVPKGYHWNDVRQVTEDVGAAIVKAFREIEKANGDKMTGIFGDGAWTNKNRLPDRLLKDLLEHFSSKCLSLANCPEDELGQGYEYLVKQFADDSGHTAQEFYTNRTVVHLMTEMLQPQSGESVYDPTCGSAGMLISCIAHLKAQGKEWRNLRIYGQEINQLTSAIGRMNLFLHGIEDFHIVNDDTLKNPAFIENGQLQQFDLVLANPPYSISQWDRAAFEVDKYGRNLYGTPPQSRADYAFIQHIIASLAPDTGRAAILLPHGVLNRKEEAEIRKAIVQSDCIDAVIGLGRHLFYNSGLESCILLLRKNKPQKHRNSILFIEAEKCTHKVQAQNYLFEDDISKIVDAYFSDTDIPDFSRRVSLDEIIYNDGNLNIKLYVNSDVSTDEGDFADNLDAYLSSSSAAHLAYAQLEPQEVSAADGGVVSFEPFDKANWKRVRLADVAEEYSARVDEPSLSEYEWYIGSDCIDGFGFRIARRQSTEKIHSAQKLFKNGDYLLVRRSLYGSDFRERAPRADFDGVCSADILTIREKKWVCGAVLLILYMNCNP